MKAENPEEAIDEFLGLPALEAEKGDWYASSPAAQIQGGLTGNFKGLQGLEAGNKARIQIRPI